MSQTHWTLSQQQAMHHRTGDMLVMAGAGSGKTAVLAQRCVQLVTDEKDPCGIDELLVVTFTEAAANEMRSRIASALRGAADTLARQRPHDAERLLQQAALVDQAQISTLHSFCSKTLRLWFHECGLDPAFEMLDKHEGQLLFAQSLRTVLDQWLVRTDDAARHLADIFDIYANSRIRRLEAMVCRIEFTWELTPDPVQWLAQARQIAAPDSQAARDRLFHAAQSQLSALVEQLAAITAQPPFQADPQQLMHHTLASLHERLGDALQGLQNKTAAAWDAARQALADPDWPKQIRVKSGLADTGQARQFKADVYDDIRKKQCPKLCQNLFAAPLDTLLQWDQQLAVFTLALLDFHSDVQTEFQRLKQAAGRLSFADLERLLLNALEKPASPVAADLQRRYQHVLVDEYQDINPVQQRLLTRMCRTPDAGSFFTVGDALQSIYGFRGGEPHLLLERAARLGADSKRVVEMTENFRTLPPLLDAMNIIFRSLFALLPPESGVANLAPLRHGRPAANPALPHILTGSPIDLIVIDSHVADNLPDQPADSVADDSDAPHQPADTDDSTDTGADSDAAEAAIEEMTTARKEALCLVPHIRQLVQHQQVLDPQEEKPRPVTYGDIAILMRSPKFQVQEFIRVFLEHGIPAQSDSTTGYFAAPEIREILALLEVLDNPLQDIPLAATLLGPLGRFSHDDLVCLRRACRGAHIPFHQAVLEAIARGPGAALPGADGTLGARLQVFAQNLDAWRDAVRTLGVPEGLAHIYQQSGVLTWSIGLPYGRQRVANLRMLHQRAMEFAGFQTQGLGRFLAFLRDLQNQDIDLGTAPVATAMENALRILSIHKSKGLEFPVVALVGLGKNFNTKELYHSCLVDRQKFMGFKYLSPDTGMQWASPQHQAIRDAGQIHILAEESRLLYVAMTRARDKLILLGSSRQTARHHWNTGTKPAARCPLDWLGPIFTQDHTQLPDGSPALRLLDAVPPAVPSGLDPLPENQAPLAGELALEAGLLAQIRAGKPLNPPPPSAQVGRWQPTDPAVEALIDRLTSPYFWQPLTQLPAVIKVTELKSHLMPDTEELPAREFIAPPSLPVGQLRQTMEAPAIQRGIATHRLLQLLDFTGPVDGPGIRRQLEALVQRHLFSPSDAALVDVDAVAWVFTTVVGQQITVIAAAARGAATSAPVGALYRELPFLWSMDSQALAEAPGQQWPRVVTPADRVLVRGVIDLLVVTPTQVHIVDYKTDVAGQIPARLPMYGRQVAYYAQAVGDILARPVTHATLLFLSPRQERSVDI